MTPAILFDEKPVNLAGKDILTLRRALYLGTRESRL